MSANDPTKKFLYKDKFDLFVKAQMENNRLNKEQTELTNDYIQKLTKQLQLLGIIVVIALFLAFLALYATIK